MGMIDGGSARVISKSQCGICAAAADYESLATNVIYAYEHRDELRDMGENGRSYYEKHFTMQSCLDNLEKILGQ